MQWNYLILCALLCVAHCTQSITDAAEGKDLVHADQTQTSSSSSEEEASSSAHGQSGSVEQRYAALKELDTLTTALQGQCAGLADEYERVLSRVSRAREHDLADRPAALRGLTHAIQFAVDEGLILNVVNSVVPSPSSGDTNVQPSTTFVDRLQRCTALCQGLSLESFVEWLIEGDRVVNGEQEGVVVAETPAGEQERAARSTPLLAHDTTSLLSVVRRYVGLMSTGRELETMPVHEVKSDLLAILMVRTENAEGWRNIVRSSKNTDDTDTTQSSNSFDDKDENGVELLLDLLQQLMEHHGGIVREGAQQAQSIRSVLQAMDSALSQFDELLMADVDPQQQSREESSSSPSSTDAGAPAGSTIVNLENINTNDKVLRRMLEQMNIAQNAPQQAAKDSKVTVQTMDRNFLQKILEALQPKATSPKQVTHDNGATSETAVEVETAPPEFLNVPWLALKRVRPASSPTSTHFPIPYHSSMNVLGKTETNPEGALCSDPGLLQPATTREYPGIVSVSTANIHGIVSLVEDGIVLVYRDWDANLEMCLDVLHRSFPWAEFLKEEDYYSDDAAPSGSRSKRYLSLRRGMFDRMLQAAYPVVPPSAEEEDQDQEQSSTISATMPDVDEWNEDERVVRLRRADTDDEGSDGRSLQAVLAVSMVTAGTVIPHLSDVIDPTLYYLNKRMVGSAFTGPWTVSAIQQFLLRQVNSGLVLHSPHQLHRVLQSTEAAAVFFIREGKEPSSKATDAFSHMLLKDVGRLRNMIGPSMPVHVMTRVDDTRGEHTDDRNSRVASSSMPARWNTSPLKNDMVTSFRRVRGSDLRFPWLPMHRWPVALKDLHLDGDTDAALDEEGPGTTSFVIFRKLKPGNKTHLGLHELSVTVVPNPSPINASWVTYALAVGERLINATEATLGSDKRSYVEHDVSARDMSAILNRHGLLHPAWQRKERQTDPRPSWLLIAHVGKGVSSSMDEEPRCLAALRKASIAHSERLQEEGEIDSSSSTRGASHHLTALTMDFTSRLGSELLAIAHRISLPDLDCDEVLLEDGRCSTCRLLMVSLSSAKLFDVERLPLPGFESRLTALLDKASAFLQHQRSSSISSEPSVMQQVIHIWKAVHRQHQHQVSATPLIDHPLPSAPYTMSTSGRRRLPILSRTFGTMDNDELARKSEQLTVVVVHDASCALSIPAIKAAKQFQRCHSIAQRNREDSKIGLLGTYVSHIHSLDVTNVSHVKDVLPWAWDMAKSTATVADGLDTVVPLPQFRVPLLIVGNSSHHLTRLPSSWVWQQYAVGIAESVDHILNIASDDPNSASSHVLECMKVLGSRRLASVRRFRQGLLPDY